MSEGFLCIIVFYFVQILNVAKLVIFQILRI